MSRLSDFKHVNDANDIQDIIQEKSTRFWLKFFDRRDIACAKSRHMRDTLSDNISDSDGIIKKDISYSFTKFDNHPSGYLVEMVTPYAVQPMHAKIYALSPTEKYGYSTYDILSNVAGYSDKKIQRLAAKGIIGHQWSDEYFPS